MEPRYVASKFLPAQIDVSEDDLAAAAAGKLDLNDLFFDYDLFKTKPVKPPLTQAEREAIVKKVLEKGAEALGKLRGGG